MIEVSASTNLIPPPTGTGIPPNATAAEITLVINALAASSGPSPLCSAQGASNALLTGDLNWRSSHGAAGSNNSAPVATNPRFPNLLRANCASFNEDLRQRSAPSKPNAKSNFGVNSAIICDQDSPSPIRANSAPVISGLVDKIAVPSLQTTPVGSSVFL